MIGFLSSSATQRSITSWQRRSISGLPRCTEAKSKLSSLLPEDTDDAALPPKPINIAGPPSTINCTPGSKIFFLTCWGLIVPIPPASIIGLWYPRTSIPSIEGTAAS